jgi:hypothetical protein
MSERHYVFGFYGLRIHKTNDIPWLFSDATLDCLDIVLNQQFTDNPQQNKVIEAAFGLRPLSDACDLSNIPCGESYQCIPQPDSLILIKRKSKTKDNDIEMALDAQKRAREISALLCICRSFGSLSISGYMDSSYLHESPLMSIKVMPFVEPSTNRFKSTLEPIKPSWIREPDALTDKQLLNALIDGIPIKTTSGRAWSIHKKIPFVRIMLKHKRNPSEQRLVRASVFAYHAHHALTPESRLAQIVTSLEMLFPGNTNFELLKQRLSQLYIFDDGGHDKISKLMDYRHLYVHDGELVSAEAANFALGIAAGIMHCYAEGLEKYSHTEALVKRLDILHKASELMCCGETEKKVIGDIFQSISNGTKDLFSMLRKSETKGEDHDS